MNGMLARARRMDTPQHAVGIASDRGLRRDRNEDSVSATDLGAGPDGRTRLLVAVADGVGGHPHGDIASRVAVRSLRDGLEGNTAHSEAALASAFGLAHQRIRETRERIGLADDMGSTLVAALLCGQEAVVANIGDSRAYVVTATDIQQISADHSVVAERVRAGALSAEEAVHSADRMVLTRSLGFSSEGPDVDTFGPLTLNESDALVLCSDGLYAVVRDEEIAAEVRADPPQQAADRLVSMANQRGGPDNISVIIVRVQSGSRTRAAYRANGGEARGSGSM